MIVLDLFCSGELVVMMLNMLAALEIGQRPLYIQKSVLFVGRFMEALLARTHTAPHEKTHTVVMSLLCWGPYSNVSYGRVYGLDPTG